MVDPIRGVFGSPGTPPYLTIYSRYRTGGWLAGWLASCPPPPPARTTAAVTDQLGDSMHHRARIRLPGTTDVTSAGLRKCKQDAQLSAVCYLLPVASRVMSRVSSQQQQSYSRIQPIIKPKGARSNSIDLYFTKTPWPSAGHGATRRGRPLLVDRYTLTVDSNKSRGRRSTTHSSD
eukprot:COSAG01_NODE_2074_length_8491_cov_4.600024_2_plen_176_part_00